MAKEKEIDIFAEKTPQGRPAYPKMLYLATGAKYPNGDDICTEVLVKDVDEHKAVLAGQKGAGEKKSGWN